MTTQMCFNPAAVASWLARMRAAGITLPVHLGVPGVAELTKLMAISARIGVADSARYLKKNKSMVGHLMTKGSFGPDAFLEALAPDARRPGGRRPGAARLHVQPGARTRPTGSGACSATSSPDNPQISRSARICRVRSLC